MTRGDGDTAHQQHESEHRRGPDAELTPAEDARRGIRAAAEPCLLRPGVAQELSLLDGERVGRGLRRAPVGQCLQLLLGVVAGRGVRDLRSELDRVPGIGPRRRRTLLTAFGSLAGVRRATREELSAVVGAKCANDVLAYFAGQV